MVRVITEQGVDKQDNAAHLHTFFNRRPEIVGQCVHQIFSVIDVRANFNPKSTAEKDRGRDDKQGSCGRRQVNQKPQIQGNKNQRDRCCHVNPGKRREMDTSKNVRFGRLRRDLTGWARLSVGFSSRFASI